MSFTGYIRKEVIVSNEEVARKYLNGIDPPFSNLTQRERCTNYDGNCFYAQVHHDANDTMDTGFMVFDDQPHGR